MNNSEEDPWYDRVMASQFLGYTVGTLEVYDCTGKYNLNPQKDGRKVRYRFSDLYNFAQSRTIKKLKPKSKKQKPVNDNNRFDANRFALQFLGSFSD